MSQFSLLSLEYYTCFLTITSADPVSLFVFARLISEKFLQFVENKNILYYVSQPFCSFNFLFKSFCPFLELGVFSSLSYVQTISKLGKVDLYVIFVLFRFLSSDEYILCLKMTLVFLVIIFFLLCALEFCVMVRESFTT